MALTAFSFGLRPGVFSLLFCFLFLLFFPLRVHGVGYMDKVDRLALAYFLFSISSFSFQGFEISGF